MQDFSVDPSKCFGSPILDFRNKILPLVKTLKFRVIFQKYALKLFKNAKNRENLIKMQFFENLLFCLGNNEEN